MSAMSEARCEETQACQPLVGGPWVMIRRSFVVAFVFGACMALAMSATAASRRRPHRPPNICRLGGTHGRGWHRVAADGEAEVYEGPGEAQTKAFYGCVYGGRPYWLGLVYDDTREGGPFAYRIVLNGAMIALESAEFGYAAGSEAFRLYVLVVDLRTRRIVHKVPTGSPPTRSVSVGTGYVSSMVVKRDGAVAWIAENFKEAQRTEAPFYQVHAVDKNGERLLASGDIASRSLALAGNTIYWTQEGEPKSATLE
jgi:hypothetical protein